MIFPKDFPDKLRSAILTSEVVSKKVKLKKKGLEFSGLCPFHNEKTPSFTVNDQKGFYHCFGCGAHGDVISFLINSEGLSYPDAVRELAQQFNIEIPNVTNFDPIFEAKTNRKLQILEDITLHFQSNLNSSKSAQSYLIKRGLNADIISKFRLGYAINSYDELINALRKKGYNDNELEETGVIGKGKNDKLYDKLRDRVIFPILDKKNYPIAFGGRTLSDEIPKYYNSSETEFFKKNKTLYNISNARKSIFKESHAIIVEGYMDVISLTNFGIENVVASLGTALSINHLQELFYITDRIIICLDGDNPGITAAKRVIDIALPLINPKKSIFFCFLPNKSDPDDYVKNFGAANFKDLINNSLSLSQAIFNFALSDLKIEGRVVTAESKAKIDFELSSKINQIKDPISQKYFSFFFKDQIFQLGKKDKFSINQKNNFLKHSSAIRRISADNLIACDQLARMIIAFILKYPNLSRYKDDDFNIEDLQFVNENLTCLKEILIENINDLSSMESFLSDSELLKAEMEKVSKISKTLSDELPNMSKFRLLLLKEFLIKIEEQYKNHLNNFDQIQTNESLVIDQQIKEIFDYKNFLQQEILDIEQELS